MPAGRPLAVRQHVQRTCLDEWGKGKRGEEGDSCWRRDGRGRTGVEVGETSALQPQQQPWQLLARFDRQTVAEPPPPCQNGRYRSRDLRSLPIASLCGSRPSWQSSRQHHCRLLLLLLTPSSPGPAAETVVRAQQAIDLILLPSDQEASAENRGMGSGAEKGKTSELVWERLLSTGWKQAGRHSALETRRVSLGVEASIPKSRAPT